MTKEQIKQWLDSKLDNVDMTDGTVVVDYQQWKEGTIELLTLIEQQAKKIEELREAEEKVSDAYLRVRALLGAYNTDFGGNNRFEVTENCIKKLQQEIEELKGMNQRQSAGIGRLEEENKELREALDKSETRFLDLHDKYKALSRDKAMPQ